MSSSAATVFRLSKFAESPYSLSGLAAQNDDNEKSSSPRSKGRGFASMDEQKQREIARKGGLAAHQKGTAHQFSPDEARAAGRKGGEVAHQRGRAHEFTSDEARTAGRKGGESVSADREHMARIGRQGGRRGKRADDNSADAADGGTSGSDDSSGDSTPD